MFYKVCYINSKTKGILVASLYRSVHGKCRIGNREVVGHGVNGSYNYKDDAHFPFPAVRFRENDKDLSALKEKEKGSWKGLNCVEKKKLYRASYCQTFAEFTHPTGSWKLGVGAWLICVSFGFWCMMFYHYYVYEPLPISLAKKPQKAQLRRMLELRVNPVDGLSSHWDYEKDKWK